MTKSARWPSAEPSSATAHPHPPTPHHDSRARESFAFAFASAVVVLEGPALRVKKRMRPAKTADRHQVGDQISGGNFPSLMVKRPVEICRKALEKQALKCQTSDVVASGKVWSSGGLCHSAATRDAMTTKVLTDRGIRSLQASRDGTPFDVFDAECPGLAIRVMGNPKRVTKSFVLVARWPGQKSASRRVIGRYGEIGLEAAREQAREWRAQIRKGIDPQAEERRAREEAERKKRSSSLATRKRPTIASVFKFRMARLTTRSPM
jgi:hypothetical protein